MSFEGNNSQGPKSETETKVVDLASFRRKKDVDAELTRGGRSPLYVSHLTGKVTGKPNGEQDADFGDRLQRIRSSLEKINRLMSDLKRMSNEEGGDVEMSSSKK